MMQLRKIALTIALGAVSACGGGGHAVQFLELPPVPTLGLDYDPSTGAVGLDNGAVVSLPTDERLLDGPVSVRSNITGFTTVRAVTPNLHAFATAHQPTNLFSTGDADTGLGRLEAVEIPVTGRAVMNGDYRGLLIANENTFSQNIQGIVTGDVLFTANFDEGTAVGAIGTRAVLDPETLEREGPPLRTLFLEETSINLDGETVLFMGDQEGMGSGLTREGESMATGSSASGSYAFVLGERGGELIESAGTVNVTHRDINGVELREYGAFTAIED